MFVNEIIKLNFISEILNSILADARIGLAQAITLSIWSENNDNTKSQRLSLIPKATLTNA